MPRHYRSIKELAKITKPGRYAVGHACYLQISQWGTRSWLLRYVRGGKSRNVGLGGCTYVTLAEARLKAFEAQRQLRQGIDPLEFKRDAALAIKARALAKTFKEVALDYIVAHEDSWRGDSSRKEWLRTLQTHAFPKIGDMSIAAIDVAAVLSVLEPIWREIPETASRVKHRIALILDWAAARELRPHDNPARRPKLLPKRKRSKKHHAALPYTDIGSFMIELRARQEPAARALEFLIITAARTNEVLGAQWDEISGDAWTVPGERMKSGKPHRVPLAGRARELLAGLPRVNEFVFAGAKGAQMAKNSLQKLLQRMGYKATVHGCRSTFRDWAAETTAYPNHVVEQALAHAIANGVEEAYRRGDLFEKRSRLMQDWSNYCDRQNASAGVTPIRTGTSA
jgi:integrase